VKSAKGGKKLIAKENPKTNTRVDSGTTRRLEIKK